MGYILILIPKLNNNYALRPKNIFITGMSEHSGRRRVGCALNSGHILDR